MESQLGTLSGLEGKSQLPLFCNEEMKVGWVRGSHSACRNRAEKILWSLGLWAATEEEGQGLGFPSFLKLLQLLPSRCKKILKPKRT